MYVQSLISCIMSDSGQQGFKQQQQEFDTLNVKPLQYKNSSVLKYSPQMALKAPVCLFYQVPLYFYPAHIDSFKNIDHIQHKVPQNKELIDSIVKENNEPLELSSYFSRKLFCVYNRFKQAFANKNDLTILIRNPARHIRNDLYATFEERIERKRCRIVFSSEFEGGNLQFVFTQKSQNTYYLLLHNDVNTHGYNFWFNFRIKAFEQGKYQFVIVNLTKQVLFQGQQSLPTFNTSTGQFKKNLGFMCRQTRFIRRNNSRHYWCLYFECEIKQKQEIYVSLTYPYSYTKLMSFVDGLNKILLSQIQVNIHIPAKSEIGNYIPCIQISKKKQRSNRLIIITARQHPSQTVGSYICQAIVKKLVASDQASLNLLQMFTVFVIPMLNPDGVIHGNSRTNIQGYDLNRCWTRYGALQSRECQNIWKFLELITEKGTKVHWSLDLHGHSRQLGFFSYFGQRNQRSILFNEILSKKSLYYNKDNAVFQVQLGKKQSIRGQFSERLKVQNTVTIQASMFGYRDKQKAFVSFDQNHFLEIGKNLVESLVQVQFKIKQSRSQVSSKMFTKRSKQHEIKRQQDLDSDSNPEEDYLLISQRKELYFNQSSSKLPLRTEISQNKRLTAEQIKTSINFKFNQQRNKSTFSKQQQIKADNKNRCKFRSQSNREFSNHNFSNRLKSIIISEDKNERNSSLSINKNNSVYLKNKARQEQDEDLRQSLQMRRKIKLAFHSKKKQPIEKQEGKSEIRSIVYPMGGSRPADNKSLLREKRGRMKEIRIHEYGVTVVRNFHNSVFMRTQRNNP